MIEAFQKIFEDEIDNLVSIWYKHKNENETHEDLTERATSVYLESFLSDLKALIELNQEAIEAKKLKDSSW